MGRPRLCFGGHLAEEQHAYPVAPPSPHPCLAPYAQVPASALMIFHHAVCLVCHFWAILTRPRGFPLYFAGVVLLEVGSGCCNAFWLYHNTAANALRHFYVSAPPAAERSSRTLGERLAKVSALSPCACPRADGTWNPHLRVRSRSGGWPSPTLLPSSAFTFGANSNRDTRAFPLCSPPS